MSLARHKVKSCLMIFAVSWISAHANGGSMLTKELSLPARIDIAEGRELNLWFDALWPATPPARVTVESDVGLNGERGFRFVPGAGHPGRSFPVTIRVHDEQARLLALRSFKLYVAPARFAVERKLQLLFIGDSLTHGVPAECRGMLSGEVQRLLADAGCQTLLLGLNDDQCANRHEGRGGWSFHSFTTPDDKAYRFSVAGVVRPPVVFSAYRHADVTYRVQSRYLVPALIGRADGVMMCSIRPADNPGVDFSKPAVPCPTGILIRVDSAAENPGDAAINFTSVEYPVIANPFWDESPNAGRGGLNFRKYMKNHGNFGGEDRIDFAFIQLGVNDCMGVAMRKSEEQRRGQLDAILEQCRALVRGIQDPDAGYPDCRVVLALTPIGCNSPVAYERSYGAQGVTMALYESAVRELWIRLIHEFDHSPEWPLVRISINGLMTDRDRSYPKKEEVINGVPNMVHCNAVHPGAAGYRQCADAFYSVLCGWLEEDYRKAKP